MGLLDVYHGRISWADYAGNQVQLDTASSRGVLSVSLAEEEYETAIESGFGVLTDGIARINTDSIRSLHFESKHLAAGLDSLNADFNLLLGDLIWKLEMRDHSLNEILDEIRLAEFEREARAYRSRAERGYLNGWYAEALSDFLEAEKRNYPDFAVLRSIASIYLYHLIDLPNALEYFRKAAKYSRPSDPRQSAEAHYFAGLVCFIERRVRDSLDHFCEATNLNPRLFEAHYQTAIVSAVAGEEPNALKSLELAISGDPRYYERARLDPAFDGIRPRVQVLLEELMKPVVLKLAEVRESVTITDGYKIARPVEAEIKSLFTQIETQMSQAKTYRSSLEFLDELSRIQQQLRDLQHLFYRQYRIDLNDYVRCVAFSPDGRGVAAGFLNGPIKIWEVYSGVNALRLDGHLASVNSVAFSPDSQWLASASRDKTIRLWDAESGAELRTMEGHAGEVRAVAFSPDGAFIVSGSHDRSVRLWRVATGKQVDVLGRHGHHVTSAAFSPDGKIIASASLDKTIKLWDSRSGREFSTLIGHTKGVQSLAFNPDGRLLASGSEDRLIKIWDMRTRREVQTLSGLRNDVSSVAFSPDGRLLAAGSLGQTVKVWELERGEVIKTLRFNEISYNSVAFSPQGQWLALGSRDLQLWLKVLLTTEDYAAVCEGEARAAIAHKNEEMFALHIMRR
jgi:WD40 repeat protein/tetratricopeptide (TPR) repeat protein